MLGVRRKQEGKEGFMFLQMFKDHMLHAIDQKSRYLLKLTSDA
jgi:hypothetical protein